MKNASYTNYFSGGLQAIFLGANDALAFAKTGHSLKTTRAVLNI
jgi:hypothetical protein